MKTFEHTWDLQRISEWRGAEVVSSDGHKLGRLNAILYDYETEEPVWLVIGEGPLGLKQRFAPVRGASPEGNRLRLSYTRSELEHQPDAIAGDSFSSLTEQRALSAYFGVPFEPDQDLRALRTGDDLPGSESVLDS